MREEFLHYLWKFRLLNLDLKTIDGDPVIVLQPGDHNNDGGPDFINARVKIGETLWAGNVEIHILSSDWFRHGHQHDKSYENIILHVVYKFEVSSVMTPILKIPTLEIMNQFPKQIQQQYDLLMRNNSWIPCIRLLHNGFQPEFALWVPSLILERMLVKCESIRCYWESCQYDWEQTFYWFMAVNFGFRINAVPFELLAKSLPLKLVKRHIGNIVQLEALLFGQAGFLEADHKDTYPVMLSSEYLFLKNKYGLSPVSGVNWRFFRLRPSSFPTIRISQFASFIQLTGGRFFQILESTSLQEIQNCFDLLASPYWDDHFLFDHLSPKRIKPMGCFSKSLLIINGIVPFLFFLGLEKEISDYREMAMNLLESMSGERNADIARWKKTGMKTSSASETQALIQLKRAYCDKKRCLDCRLGMKILQLKYDPNET